MANECDVDLTYTFKNSDAAQAFEDKIMGSVDKESFYASYNIGAERYVLDPDLSRPSSNVVAICGWVKWALEDVDVYDAIKYAGDQLESFHAFYREDGCGLYGNYHWYEEQESIDIDWLPTDFWPKWDDEKYQDDIDTYDNLLFEAYHAHGTSKTIPFKEIEDLKQRNATWKSLPPEEKRKRLIASLPLTEEEKTRTEDSWKRMMNILDGLSTGRCKDAVLKQVLDDKQQTK